MGTLEFLTTTFILQLPSLEALPGSTKASVCSAQICKPIPVKSAVFTMARTPGRPTTAAVGTEGMGQPTPRSRGRPRKNATTAEQQSVQSSEPVQPVPTPRSRGRPKKKPHHRSKQALEAARLQREAQLERDAASEEATPSKQLPTAPRPRGRPKKIIAAAVSSPEEGASDSSRKSPVTAVMINAAKDELRAEIHKLSDGSRLGRLAPASRRGPGRPKKAETADTKAVASDEKSLDVAEDTHRTLNGEVNDSNNGNVPVKRGRGRPRKSDTPTKSVATGSRDRTGPSQVAQAFSNQPITNTSPTDTTTSTAKRGRGRPKKNSSSSVSLTEAVTNSNTEELAGGYEADTEAVDGQIEDKAEITAGLRDFIIQDEDDLDEDEDYEPSPSPSRSPSPPPSQPTILEKRGAPLDQTDVQNPKKRLRGFGASRKTVSRISFPKTTTTDSATKPAVDKSYTTTITNPLLASLVGDYNVSYAIVGDKVHPGRLTVKFATDGGDDMLAGSLELSRWSGVMRFALTEQKVRQYVLKQERIEQQGLVLSDIVDQDDDEDEIALLEDKNPSNGKGKGKGKEVATSAMLGNGTAISHKRKASNDIDVEIPSKHRKVSQSSSSELHTLYFVYRIKDIFTEKIQHKAQVGTIQFYTAREGHMAFENAMISVPGDDQLNELSGEARKDKGPEWPTQDWLWGDFAEPRSN
ncbi:hypothetical protein B0T21DRAFT_452257 [Apiosordaria backusii]|uniref:Uncharacterized protein n=1 Tax=Apiosordaria backusii TaxID=314023 RepID=A0AA40BED1_9PEZI|nr:hypothetical protein B0T21DRAFT_452257 [Apiosordaria backusii]